MHTYTHIHTHTHTYTHTHAYIPMYIITVVFIAPLQHCLLRSAPSTASVKHNGLEGREEGDGVINTYLAKSDRKPIPGRRASNRKGTGHGNRLVE